MRGYLHGSKSIIFYLVPDKFNSKKNVLFDPNENEAVDVIVAQFLSQPTEEHAKTILEV